MPLNHIQTQPEAIVQKQSHAMQKKARKSELDGFEAKFLG